jgi:hypothetical protein
MQEFARRTSVIEKQAEEEFSLGAAAGYAANSRTVQP